MIKIHDFVGIKYIFKIKKKSTWVFVLLYLINGLYHVVRVPAHPTKNTHPRLHLHPLTRNSTVRGGNNNNNTALNIP